MQVFVAVPANKGQAACNARMIQQFLGWSMLHSHSTMDISCQVLDKMLCTVLWFQSCEAASISTSTFSGNRPDTFNFTTTSWRLNFESWLGACWHCIEHTLKNNEHAKLPDHTGESCAAIFTVGKPTVSLICSTGTPPQQSPAETPPMATVFAP